MALLDIIKSGGQTVRIYHVRNRNRPYLKVSYNWAGEWRAKMLANNGPADERRARGVAREIATAIAEGRADQIADIGEGLKVLRTSEELLASTGLPVDIAARDFAYAHKLLDGRASVVEAAEFFAKTKATIAKEVATRDAVEEFIEAQKQDRASIKYLNDIRSRLRRFARENGGYMTEHKAGQIKLWLRGLKLSARSRNNYLMMLKTFFHWAQVENYLPRNVPTEVDDIKKIAAPSEIHIHDADTVATMLAGAVAHVPAIVPYLACGYFAAIRPHEMQRMDGRAIRFAHNDIEVKDWQAKGTRKLNHRRLIPMQPNLSAWLTQFPVQKRLATGWTGTQVRQLARRLGMEWHHDVMRHTAISNLVALTQNVDQVALWAGNSRQVIYSSYLQMVTPAEAREYFTIEPPSEANVVRLPGAAGARSGL